MDFLDPKKRRSRGIRLMVRYAIMTIAIVVGTVLLVFEAYGFGYNRETGQVVQNGLVFLNSQPVSSKIYINGQQHSSDTDARLILPANQYKFELKRTGYHDWQRSLFLEAGSLDRLVYPMLIPTSLTPKSVSAVSLPDPLYTQSPDRRWLLVQTQTSQVLSIGFDLFDTSVKPSPQKTNLQLPANIIQANDGKLTEVEWSSDNKHALLQYRSAAGVEFILLDRESPSKSININSQFSIKPTAVTLKDKKIEQLYIYNQDGGTLSVASLSQKTIAQPFLEKVIAYKSYGNDIVSYVTVDPANPASSKAVIWEKGQKYTLQPLKTGENFVIDQARFDDHWYYIFGSNKQDQVAIYKDPVETIKNQTKKTTSPLLYLEIANVQFAGFSANTRFISVQSGQNFVIRDLEVKESFKYQVDSPISGKMRWMDGHRLLGISNAKAFMMDFDGINRHLLVNSSLSAGAYFDRDYEQMFVSASDSATPTAVSLQRVAMYSEADMPNNLR